MVDYTKPLEDPILESAARIAYAANDPALLSECRRACSKYQNEARNLIASATRQIDHLRAIGAIPSPSMATDYPRLTQGYQPRSTGSQPLDPPIGGSSATRPSK